MVFTAHRSRRLDRFVLVVRVGDSVVDQSSVFILKVDLVSSGTLLRIGRSENERRAIEHLSLGDEVFDPIENRYVEITEMACVTLDGETIRDRGFSPKRLAGDASANPLIYAVKVPLIMQRAIDTPPIRGEHSLIEGTVFFALGFERRAVVETPSAYVEFVRPSNYALETPARRSGTALTRDQLLAQLRS